MSYTAVNLSRLDPPDAVEQVSYETILAGMLDDLRSRDPGFSALVESDPAMKVLEVAAYRETLIRQRVNEAARAVMLAYATGADLDHLGANVGIARLVVTPADPEAVPPVAAVMEGDAEFRARIQLAPEGLTTAGPSGGYRFHALSADGRVLDAQPVSPSPGMVSVYVMSREGNGTASPELLSKVEAALSSEDVRPMTDNVSVQSVTVTDYAISATLTVHPGPDSELIRQLASEAAAAYAAESHRIGRDVTLSGLYAALHRPGVQNVELTAPATSLVMADGQAAYCTSVSVTIGGTDV